MSGVSIAFLLVRRKWSCFFVAAVPSFVKKKKEKEKSWSVCVRNLCEFVAMVNRQFRIGLLLLIVKRHL